MSIRRHAESSSGKANNPKIKREFPKNSWHQCPCSGSNQFFSWINFLNYHQFLSLYKIKKSNNRSELTIYDTIFRKEEIKILDAELTEYACITQLPSGILFCYGAYDSGITLTIDRRYEVRMLPSGIPCGYSSALYYKDNIYCFGGRCSRGGNNGEIALSAKFDLKKKRWINLAPLPNADYYCSSVIFNENILISGYNHWYLWLYSIETNSFSRILYGFTCRFKKLLICVDRLYLIEWNYNGFVYESEDVYHWKPVSQFGQFSPDPQMYCLKNKEKVYISSAKRYFQFDLKKKVLSEIKV